MIARPRPPWSSSVLAISEVTYATRACVLSLMLSGPRELWVNVSEESQSSTDVVFEPLLLSRFPLRPRRYLPPAAVEDGENEAPRHGPSRQPARPPSFNPHPQPLSPVCSVLSTSYLPTVPSPPTWGCRPDGQCTLATPTPCGCIHPTTPHEECCIGCKPYHAAEECSLWTGPSQTK